LKNVIVTGASFGIGEAISKSLSSEFNVLACARRKDLLQTLSSYSGNIIPIELDITSTESVKNLNNIISDVSIHALINCAGGGGGPMKTNILEEEQEFLNNSFDINVSSTFNLIKSVYPRMKSEDSPIIINITSIAGYQIFSSSSPYTMSKHSQAIMSKILRRDLAPHGIRLTEIVPGSVNSHRDKSQSAAIMPEDVAEIVSFIVKSKSPVNINTIYVSHIQDVPFLS
jgi:NADP-dependent 3-hydroxy acid dehydrogenase YdfG